MRIFVWITLLVALFAVIEAQLRKRQINDLRRRSRPGLNRSENNLVSEVGAATGNAIKRVGNALANNVIASSSGRNSRVPGRNGSRVPGRNGSRVPGRNGRGRPDRNGRRFPNRNARRFPNRNGRGRPGN